MSETTTAAPVKAIRMKGLPEPKRAWEVKAAADGEADVFIYGDIIDEGERWWYDEGEEPTSAISFREELKALGDVRKINLYVASYGGNFPEGLAIASVLAKHPAQKVGYVDGYAASAVTLVLAACDRIVAPSFAMLNYHFPKRLAFGYFSAADFRALADWTERLHPQVIEAYRVHTPGLDDEVITELLDRDEWITAADALQFGLIDEIDHDASKLAASAKAIDVIAHSTMLPEGAKAALVKGVGAPEETSSELSEADRAAIVAQAEEGTRRAKEVLIN